ncbi:MAG: MarC family protein [Burkholderiales bacterium]
MNADLLSATILLVLVLDPFGNLPLVVSALARVPAERHARIVVRECLFAFVILLAFMAGGRTFLTWLQLSDVSLSIAGGIILFLIALRMVFPHKDGVFGDLRDGEPFLVPLAVPSIAGPSALATVMLMASRDPAHLATWVAALTIAMAVTTVVLMAAGRLQAALGERAVNAFERLMGLVLTALAVEMLLNGVRTFVAQLPK